MPVSLAMTDTVRCPDMSHIVPRLPKTSAVIYRNGDHPDRWALAHKHRNACRRHDIPFIWAGTAAEALEIGADGLHLRDDTHHRAKEITLWRRKSEGLVLAAAHSLRAMQNCQELGVNGVLVSPVFPTRSHPGAACLGITRFRFWTQNAELPVYALGGITDRTAPQLSTTSCTGIAGIDWFLSL